jgi:hypothetical protein
VLLWTLLQLFSISLVGTRVKGSQFSVSISAFHSSVVVLSMNNQQHMLNWLRQSTASIFFFSFIGRYVCAVQRQLKTRSNVINALSHWITIYSHGILEHVEKEIQPISCCNHLEICSVPPGSLLVTFGGCTQTVGLFSPRIF